MPRFTKPLAASCLLVIGMLSAGSAAAQDSVGARVATGVGHWIAAQGNQALREIGEELRERLAETLKPALPEPEDAKTDEPSSVATAN